MYWHPRLANLPLIYFPRGNSLVSAEKKVKRGKKAVWAHLHNSAYFSVPFVCTTSAFCDISFCTWPLSYFLTSLCLFSLFCLITFPTLREWMSENKILRLAFSLTSFKIRTGLRGPAYFTWLSISFCCFCTANISDSVVNQVLPSQTAYGPNLNCKWSKSKVQGSKSELLCFLRAFTILIPRWGVSTDWLCNFSHDVLASYIPSHIFSLQESFTCLSWNANFDVTGSLSGAWRPPLRMWSCVDMCKRGGNATLWLDGLLVTLEHIYSSHVLFFFLYDTCGGHCSCSKFIFDLLMLSKQVCENGDICLDVFLFD